MILSVLVGLAALAGMVLFIIILISPTKTTLMNKWACNNNLGGGGYCVRSSDGYNTESDCMDQCFPCKERKSVDSCGLPGDCSWRPNLKTCHACSDLNEVQCKLSKDCTYTPSTSGDLEGICARSAFVPGYDPKPIPVGPPAPHLSK